MNNKINQNKTQVKKIFNSRKKNIKPKSTAIKRTPKISTKQRNTFIKKIEELQEELSNQTEKFLRLSAEFDNYRKRNVKEKMELIKNAGESILTDFLPIIDDIERAITSIEKTNDIKSIKYGIDLIYKHILKFILQNGIKQMEVIGKDFNTDLHEAVTKMPTDDKKKKGKVVDCIEKGYFLHEKVIRFSKVVIAE